MQNLFPESVEVAVLGAMLLDAVAQQDATAELVDSDFSLATHQTIYATMHRMIRAQRPVDLITLVRQLQDDRKLDAIGGRAYLYHLSEGIPRNLHIAQYVGILKDAGLGRRGVETLETALASLKEYGTSSAAILDALTHSLMEHRMDTTRNIQDVLPKLMQSLDAPSCLTISSGIGGLNAALKGGWRTKELGIIAAFPSGGKSALVRQTERAAMRDGIPTHAFSVEIPEDRWLRHHAGRLANLQSFRTREPDQMPEPCKDAFKQAIVRMDAWPYRVDDSAGMNIDALVSKARFSNMRYGTKLFTVDFLQLLVQNPRNEVAEIADIIWKLKRLAKDHDVSVVALSQLTEDRGTGKSDGEPRVNQMRGSGAIRQAADVVVLCSRPEDEEGKKTGEDALIVAKNRDGVTGHVPLHFSTDTLEFEDRRNENAY